MANLKRFALLIGVQRADNAFVVLDCQPKASQLESINSVDPAEISQVGILKDVQFQKLRALPQPVATAPVPTTGAVGSPTTTYDFNVHTTQAGGTTRYTVGTGSGITPADPTTGSTSVADNVQIAVLLSSGKIVKMRTFGPAGYLPSSVVTKVLPA